MKITEFSQPIPLATTAQFDESREGGLELGNIWVAIRRRAFIVIGVTAAIASTGFLKSLNNTPVYQARFEILTEAVTPENQVISSLPGTLASGEKNSGVSSEAVLSETKLRILQSPRLLAPVVEQLQTQYPELTYSTFINNLAINPVSQNTNVLGVAYRNEDPEQVKAALNLLAKAYLDYSLEERKKDIRRGYEFVEAQLPQLKGLVQAQQDRLQKFRQQYNLVEPELQGKELTEQVHNLKQQQLDIQLKLDQAKALYSNLQSELSKNPIELTASSALRENPRYQNILNQILELDSQISKESAIYLEESPNIQVLQDKRRNLIPLLSYEAQKVQRDVISQIKDLEVQNRSLTQAIEQLNQQVKLLPFINREYDDIKRELDIATNNLSQFLAKREGLRIDGAQKEVPWQILTPPSQPIGSSRDLKQNLVLATALGLLLGIGVALVVDKLSNVLHTSKDIKGVSKLPLLGVIPFNKEIERLIPARNESTLLQLMGLNWEIMNGEEPQPYKVSRFFEAFRSLYANIRLVSSNKPIRSVVISSAAAEDGKSTVALHLAQVIAATGRRVLLVDANLRSPCLHHQFGILNNRGLTNIIVQKLDYNQIVQLSSPLQSSLFILTAGLAIPDPVSILASTKMQYLMDQLQSEFDLVIYDTPSLVGLADAHLIAAHTDGVLLVASLGKLKRSVLEQALEELAVSNTPVLGVVANQYKDSGSSHQEFVEVVPIPPKRSKKREMLF